MRQFPPLVSRPVRIPRTRLMTSTSLRTVFGLTLALLGFAKANAQAQINIDWSNLSAVTFSGTGSTPW